MRIDSAQSEGIISGFGIPTGGTANQVLAKIDGDNYNTQWVNAGGSSNPTYYDAGTTSTDNTINWSNGISQQILVDNNPKIYFTNGVSGQTQSLVFKQDQSGSPIITWSNDVIWTQNVEGQLPTLNSFGSVNTSFNEGGDAISSGSVLKTVVKPNGNLLIGGSFLTYNSTTTQNLVEVNKNGDIVTSFGTLFNSTVRSIQQQPNGKLIIAGQFSTFSGVSQNRIVRLNSDYSFDSTFSIGTGFNGIVWATALLEDGSLVVVGEFSTYNGVNVGRIAKLNSNGSLDTTFNTNVGSGANGPIYDIILTSDNKLRFGGAFSTFNGLSKRSILGLNLDGTIDNTFDILTGITGNIFVIQELSDSKILFGGTITQYRGQLINGLIKLNTDGTLDNTFNIGSGFQTSTNVRSLYELNDGRIMVGGGYTTFSGISANRIAILNPDGSFNSTLGTGFDQFVYVILPFGGSILLGGDFTTYNGVSYSRIVLINGTIEQYTQFNFLYTGNKYIGSIPSYSPL